MVKKITESQLRNMISKAICESMEEGAFGNWLQDKFCNFHPGKCEYDANASIEKVAKQNGWEINTLGGGTTDTHFELVQMTSGFGEAKNGVLSPKELVDDINLHLNGKGRVVNAKVGNLGDRSRLAKTLSFDIQYN